MTEREDVEDIIERHWPYDGPHEADTVIDAANAISGLVRYMNNATQYRHTLQYAPQVNRVLGALGGAAYGLDQLVDQLKDTVYRLAQDKTLYDDRHNRPGSQTASELIAELVKVQAAAGELAHAIDGARTYSNHLGHNL
ncbi:hypothetical protein GCM10029964_128910 [Kibdelosporangium lantanae]